MSEIHVSEKEQLRRRLHVLQRKYNLLVKIRGEQIYEHLNTMTDTDLDLQAMQFAFVPQEHDFTPDEEAYEGYDLEAHGFDFNDDGYEGYDLEAHGFDFNGDEEAYEGYDLEAHGFDFTSN